MPPPSDAAEVLGAARSAIEAWGRFAATGDLNVVAGPFAQDGPQYQRLTQEAAAGPPPQPPPQFTLVQASVRDERPEGDRVVRTDVDITSTPGAPPQRYRWDLRLRRDAGGNWQVWNIREAP